MAGTLALAITAGGRAAAESIAFEELVITAGRLAEAPETVGSSHTVITREEIEHRQAEHLYELLREVPGISISSTGSGRLTGIRMRGAEDGQTAVMIDGVRVYDPVSPRAALDLSLLPPPAAVERIEVIRGPQSTLYGSDAMGGVINIITRRGEGPPTLTTSLRGGSQRTWNPAVNLRGAQGAFRYNLDASLLDSAGISLAEGGERDAYRRHGLGGSLAWQATEALSLALNVQSWQARFELDDWTTDPVTFASVFVDDPDYEGDNRFQGARLTAEHEATAAWRHRLNLAHWQSRRHTSNDPDANNINYERSRYRGKTQSAEWQHDLAAADWLDVVAGLAFQREQGAAHYEADGLWGPFVSTVPTRSASTGSLFLQNRFSLGNLYLNLGGRTDRHSRFGSHATWRTTAAWRLPGETRIHASYGTGFNAPSLFDLNDPNSGNPDLEPEESRGWDLGASRAWFFGEAVFRLETTYFQRKTRNQHAFGPAWIMENIDRTAASGFEHGAGFEAGPFFSRLDYTRLNATNKATGQALLRRPRHAWHLRVGRHFGTRATVSLAGRRLEKQYDFGPVRLDDHTVCDLYFDYRLNPQTTLQVKVVNLFDEDYQEIHGYATENRAFYAGLARAW